MAVNLAKQDRNANSKPQTVENPLVGIRVLVVDDSPMQRSKLKELYHSLGMQCVGEAGDGLECLEKVEKLKPDLISLDIIMPQMHGVETLGYLRRQSVPAVIIFVSALGSVQATTELKSRGYSPDAVFSKKDTRDTFAQVLGEIFGDEAVRATLHEELNELRPTAP
jgi:two-component system chemotaxis response regulator CheY